MSHVALQRVMVRMLYDPEFTAKVLAGDERALDGAPLSAEERAWLREPDPRAWRVDPERPTRSLGVLLQQYPASVALAVRSAGGTAPLAAFFRSDRFHRAVQDRGSMALAFGEHLAALTEAGTLRDRRVLAMARLEQAIVRLHRAAHPLPPARDKQAEAFRLSPDKALHAGEKGIGDLHEEIHWALTEAGPDLGHAVLDNALAMPKRRLDPARHEHLLLELARDDGPRVKFMVGTAEITEAFHELLSFAAEPRSFEALTEQVEHLGADPDEAPDVIAGLIDEGTLVPAAPARG